jgi:signal transduction histidine kinase
MESARRMANDLRPAAFAHMILQTALTQHIQGFAALSSLKISIREIAPFPQLDEATNLAFYRATQEILTNIAKHAGATSVDIQLRSGGGRLWIEIDDDGVGIRDEDLTKSGSLGLLGIRERFMALGGGLTIQKREPRGTRVVVYIPQTLSR